MGNFKNEHSGIYGIYCTNNNKWYVGRSETVQKRKSKHKQLLRKNKHHNIHLQQAWNKYGEDNFSFITLEKCDKDLKTLQQAETKWCLFYKAHLPEFGFCVGLPDTKTEETLQKIKETRLKTKKINYPLVVINKTTKEILKYNSPTEASKLMNLKITKIQKVLSYWSDKEFKSYYRMSYANFIFIYEKFYNPLIDYTIVKKRKRHNKV